MIKQSARHISYFAFLGHRLSGLVLAIFLPAHFLVLGLALENKDQLDGFLKWSDQPLVKIAEWGLIGLLTIHLAFGLRLLVIEFLPWKGLRTKLIWLGGSFTALVAIVFLVRGF